MGDGDAKTAVRFRRRGVVLVVIIIIGVAEVAGILVLRTKTTTISQQSDVIYSALSPSYRAL